MRPSRFEQISQQLVAASPPPPGVALPCFLLLILSDDSSEAEVEPCWTVEEDGPKGAREPSKRRKVGLMSEKRCTAGAGISTAS